VPGGDLDVPQVHARVQHGGDEGMTEHVRVRPGDPHSSGVCQAPQAAGGGMAVHPRTAAAEQDRATGPGSHGTVDGTSNGRWQWDQDYLAPLAAHTQHAMAVCFAEIGGIRAGCFEDPQAEQPEHGHQCEVAWVL